MIRFRRLGSNREKTGERQEYLSLALLKKEWHMENKSGKGTRYMILEWLEQCSKIVEYLGLFFATASGFVMLFSLLVGVVTRWLPFMTSAIWSEEIARMCMLWLTTNGASVAFRHMELVRFNLLTDMLPKKIQYVLEVTSSLCTLIVLGVLLKYGYEMLVLKSKVEAAATHISYFWWALGLYLGFVFMTIHAIKFLFEDIVRGKAVLKGGNE